MPKVSVIIPIYNVEKYLRQCLDSVIAQDFTDWEMILVDDGSTDGSGIIADEYAADERIYLIHQKNLGSGAARNTGLREAHGEYVYFLDSDDYIDKELLKTCIESLEKTSNDMAVFNFRTEDEDGVYIETSKIQPKNIIIREQKQLIDYYIKDFLSYDMAYCLWNKFYKRSIIDDNKIRFEENENLAEDLCFNMEYAMYIKKVVCISDVLYTYRIRTGSVMDSSKDVDIVNLYTNIGYRIYTDLRDIKRLNNVYSKFYIIFSALIFPQYIRKTLKDAKNAAQSVENKEFLKKMNQKYLLHFVQDTKALGVFRASNSFRYTAASLMGLMGQNVCYVKFLGGLGNQMFQYAFYKALKQRGCRVYADLSYYRYDGVMPFKLDEVFKKASVNKRFCKNGILTDGVKKLAYIGKSGMCEKADAWYDKNMIQNITGGVYTGYWQTEKYFTGIERELRQDFRFGYGEEKLKALAGELRRSNSVSVHIRRGDYLDIQDVYGGICTMEYYANAIDRIKDMAGQDARFYFFSNDIEWVKTQFKGDNYHYISEELFESYEDWYDMCLMSSCRHNIIANSSFSWWGAWLNDNEDKIVIAPSKWLNTGETPDIWCDGWIRI